MSSASSLNPTVLIHGYGFDHRIWYPVELAFEGRHVINLSLPGFGKDSEKEAYTIPSLASKYWRHLNEVVSEPVHLVGHSMGGYVSIEMLHQQPSKVASIVFVHSHVFEDSPEKKKVRGDTMKDITENGREGFVKKLIPSLFGEQNGYSEIINMLIQRGMAYDDNAWCLGAQAMRDREDHTQTLKNANIPVLVLLGENDKAIPLEIAQKQAQLSDNITMHIYPGVGHLSMYEKPAAIIQDLIRFYNSAD